MKYAYLFLATLLLSLSSLAQEKATNTSKSFSQISIRGGYDVAQKHDFSNFASKNLKGFNAGASFDKYWNWLGAGIDVDFLQNQKPEYTAANDFTTYMTAQPYILGTDYNIQANATKLTRIFAGIGPDFKYQTVDNKWTAELNLRGGVTRTDGSMLEYSTKAVRPILNPFLSRGGDAVNASTVTGNSNPENEGVFYHKGYDKEYILTAKAQARISYTITDNLSANVAAYYMYYQGSKALYNTQDYTGSTPPVYATIKPTFGLSALSSLGASAGISYRIFGNQTHVKKQKGYNTLTVFVKDELTNQPLHDVDVMVTNAGGNNLTAKTDINGQAIFQKIKAADYVVKGTLHDIATNTQTVNINSSNQKADVTLIHNDPRFTVVGTAINLGTKTPEGGVSTTLKDLSRSTVKMATSQNSTGKFSYQLEQNTDYELVGKKANYISNIERVSTKGLTRSQTLYVQLELGIERVEVGKAIVLKKIYYDLDKTDIREDASSDLQKLISFLNDNPNIKIEISSFTDSRGSGDYNLELSQKRAQSVVSYLINRGIDRGRMIAKGYGESKPVVDCVECTEAQHQQNRRTEFKLISQ
ncbi:hypothetical protein EZJ43_00650 [Pedobacter changchengzhani]|uniref:OmpA-like domain-containing protein n=1 Tax=Pedobacter changchengzhani TaxID=2529274 RepID=A0A4R5MPK9_9SPHI|nr:OmpA family protein [Pedobacter changchengzhani]TDG37638.1 hypothetical protein EZJ43_00650 [Pedobacter changchengzhani]